KEQIIGFSKNIAEKVKLIETLQAKIDGQADDTMVRDLHNFTILTDDDWRNFKESFEKVYPGYWIRLELKFPNLTLSEKRFMALSRLGMDNKEMAAASGVSPQTIRVLTYRMRKKLFIAETSDLKEIANSI
ncbi:MAG: helix-turn-helix transcriptional regulator, partial [Chitinophagaceae bacterium]